VFRTRFLTKILWVVNSYWTRDTWISVKAFYVQKVRNGRNVEWHYEYIIDDLIKAC